jgi:hypothetical protein
VDQQTHKEPKLHTFRRLLHSRTITLLLLVALSVLFAEGGCGGSGGDGDSSTSTSTTRGTVAVNLTDATTDSYQAVYVTIDTVQVHETDGDSWQTVGTPQGTYDLLELANGVTASLGNTTVPAGDYTQMRLYIGESADSGTNILGNTHPYANYVIDASDAAHELKVPSGTQSGLKLTHGFSVEGNGTTVLLLDFDAEESVVQAGNSGQWLLKPTIRVYTTAGEADEVTTGTVAGNLTASANATLDNAKVSAQVYDAAAASVEDQVSVAGSTVAEQADGATAASYELRLDAGDYTMVAYKTGYDPACGQATVTADARTTQSFTLVNATTGTVSGSVTVYNATLDTEDDFVELSFRQDLACEGSTATAEIASINVALADNSGIYEGTYNATLTSGTYQVIATVPGSGLTADQETVSTGATQDFVVQ